MVIGTAKLVSTPKYFPLRFHCCQILASLSATTGTSWGLPVACFHLQLLMPLLPDPCQPLCHHRYGISWGLTVACFPLPLQLLIPLLPDPCHLSVTTLLGFRAGLHSLPPAATHATASRHHYVWFKSDVNNVMHFKD